MARCAGLLVGIATMALVAGNLFAATGQATPPRASEQTRCTPQSGRELERAKPEQVGLDSALLADALTFAATRNRFNVQVFRHNCLIGEGPTNNITGTVAWNIWSATKSIVSMLAGIAWEQRKLDIYAPIGRYLPAALVDDDHAAITVQHLLTESSGMKVGAITEGITGVIPIDPNSAVQALGTPLDNPPGTAFSYSQRNVDLLSYVLELAVGEPLQDFAQRELFDPLGIERGDYYWARDRSGHTYGYAHLMIPPNDFAKLGLLAGNDGRWGSKQIVSERYLRLARTPSTTNPCYGYLFWLGPGCDEATERTPSDVYLMDGLGAQNVFVVRHLDLTVVWTGIFGNKTDKGLGGALQNGDELPYEFFRKVYAAFVDQPIPDTGPYIEPPVRLNPSRYVDMNILLAVFGLGPDANEKCNVFSCLDEPLTAPFTDTPPGCVLLVCVGPDPRTPGIR